MLNKNAKEYIPTKHRGKQNGELNINAKEYKPSHLNEPDDQADNDRETQDQIYMIAKDMAEDELIQDLQNEEEDKFFPKYQNCTCCHGYVYKCKGPTCQALGQCYCKMKDDCDEIEEEKK